MKVNSTLKGVLFWGGVIILTFITGYMAYLDALREPVDCPFQNQGTSAFLVLKTLDTSSKQIQSSLLVSNFKRGEDVLVVNSITPGSDPETANYESVLKEDPSPTPEASPRPTPVLNRSWSAVGLQYNSQSFFYPFEDYVLNFELDFTKKTGEQIPVNLQVKNQIDEAIIVKNCTAGYSFDKNASDPNSFNFVLKRHRFVRATAVILYSVAFAFLVYIATREETSKVLSNSLGYLAALWGVRAIIIGSAKMFPTVVDFITLGLYVAVVAIVAYKWLFSTKVSP